MKHYLLFFLLLAQISTGFAQEIRQGVKRTKISLVPPAGFTQAKKFCGFENKTTGVTLLFMALKIPYQRAVSDFDAAAKHLSRGVTQLDKKSIITNNIEGTWIKQKQSAENGDFHTQIFVFEYEKSSMTITALYPANNGDDAAIEDALRSCKIGRFEYEVEVLQKRMRTDNHFIPFQSKIGVLSYRYISKVKNENDDLTFSVRQDTISLDTSNRKAFAIEKIRHYDNLRHISIKKISPISVNGFEGYEMLTDARGKGIAPHLVYGIVLFGSNKEYFIFYAIGGKAATPDFYAFTQMVRSFQ